MGEFDATIAAAGYRDTEISQEHASQKNRGGSQLSRDQKKRENTWEQRKNRVGWVPVKPGPKQKERAHVSRERRGCCGSQLSRDKTKRKRAHESRERRVWVSPSSAETQTLQTRNTWDAINGWIRCNDSSCWLSGHRNHPRTCIPEKQGWVPVKSWPKQQEREHLRAEKE